MNSNVKIVGSIMFRVLCTLILMESFSVSVLAVVQFNGNDDIQLSTDVIEFTGDIGPKEVKLLKGGKIMVYSGSDWVKYGIAKNGIIQVSVKPYNRFYPRQARVILTSKKTNFSKVLTIVQKSANVRDEFVPKTKGNGLCFLSEMDLTKGTCYYIKEIHKNKSVDGHAITMKNSRYEEGISTHAPSILRFRLNGAKRFIADMAIDDEVLSHHNDFFGFVGYKIELDGKVVKEGKFRLYDNETVPLAIELNGAKEMKMLFSEEGSTYGDHVDLGNARFEYVGEKPTTLNVK